MSPGNRVFEAAVLACSVYVDLNPIRAGMAKTPESSHHTSAHERIASRGGRGRVRKGVARSTTRRRGRATASRGLDQDGWLSPVEAKGEPAERARRNRTRRASNKGFLSMRLEDYLKILDWTGRQVRRDKRGSIPAELAPILERLGVSDEYWLDCVENFGRWFHRAAGSVSALSSEAARVGKHWLQGMARCGEAFA